MWSKLLYAIGIGCFALSFFLHTTPAEVSEGIGNDEGKEVTIWDDGLFSNLEFALEPPFDIYEFFTVSESDFDFARGEKGDSVEDVVREHRSHALYRTFYSLPASLGFFAICASIFIVPVSWTKKEISQRLRMRFLVAGGTVLLAVPLIIGDFYYWASLWHPYFHLGAGAYCLIAAYALIGISLLVSPMRAAIQRRS